MYMLSPRTFHHRDPKSAMIRILEPVAVRSVVVVPVLTVLRHAELSKCVNNLKSLGRVQRIITSSGASSGGSGKGGGSSPPPPWIPC
jgi:hypothetical protein